MSNGSSTNLVKIDVLRGVAILMVLAFHSFLVVFGARQINLRDAMSGSAESPAEWYWFSYVLRVGYAGVPLFFVISGYVIHRSFLLDNNFAWSKYFGRRFWRIYPAYFLALVVFAILGHVLRTKSFVMHALLIHNFSWRFLLGINGSFWSLAVEVQFYILYPIALRLRSRLGFARLMCFAMFVSFAGRLAAFADEGWPEGHVSPLWASALSLWPDWLLGAWMAERHLAGAALIKKPLLVLCFGVLLFVLGEFFRPFTAIQFSAASLVAAVVLEQYLQSGRKVGFLAGVCAKVGIVSYSVYLIHEPLMGQFNELMVRTGFEHPLVRLCIGFPLYLLVMGAIATVMYFVVEKNGVRLGNYLRNRRLVRQ